MRSSNFSLRYFVGMSVFLAFLECIWFAPFLFTPYLIGDAGDARFNMFIMEHIYQFLLGNHSFTDVGIYYPTPNTISYSDMNLGTGLFHSLFRLLGFNMYLSAHYAWILIHFIGTLTLFFFLKYKIHLHTVFALIGTILFSYSNAYMMELNRPQLLAMSFLPIVIWLAFNALQYIKISRKRIPYTLLCLISLALILYTSWYTACFTAFITCLWGLCFLILGWKQIRWTYIKAFFSHKLEIFGYLIFSAILITPFILISLPSYYIFQRRYQSRNLPSFLDFIDVSPDNILYGSLLDKFVDYSHRPGLLCGFAFLTLALILCSIFGQLFAFIRTKAPTLATYLKASLALLCLAWFLLIFKWTSDAPDNPWNFLQRVIPAIGTLRFEQRLLFVISLPTAILVAISLADFFKYKNYKKKVTFLIATLLCFYLFVENYKPTRNHNIYVGVTEWNTPFRYRLINTPPPPAQCRVMYAVNISALDTWEVANKYNLKTTAGYSGGDPEFWRKLKLGNTGPDIHPRMKIWIKHYGIQDICYYDKNLRKWEMVIPEDNKKLEFWNQMCIM